MRRNLALAYGAACYAIFFGTFLYLVAFLANAGVPRSVDVGPESPVGGALAIDLALLLLFGFQHSVMARPAFKEWSARFVPRSVERSTYVLLTSAVLGLIFWQWRPVLVEVWEFPGIFQRPALWSVYLAGVGLVLYSTCLIDHFELFGLRQAVARWRGQPPAAQKFVTPSLYRWIRHPLYVGWMITFWATPSMTAGHLVFAIVMSGYILVAIPYEERDLAASLGDDYQRYRESTPMFVPRPAGLASGDAADLAEVD